jgi:UDP-N-acetyl-D-glucosamine dehydrogenase
MLFKRRFSPKTEEADLKQFRVAVIGVGYVGLPLAVRLAERGFSVIAIDIKEEVIKHLKSGKSTVDGLSDERVDAAVRSLRLKPLLVNVEADKTSKRAIEALMGVHVFVVCVETPLHPKKGWNPETKWIERSSRLIRRVSDTERATQRLPQERLIVLESTTYPGTTNEIFGPLIDTFAKNGRRWHLAYSPERMSPGVAARGDETTTAFDPFIIARVVGGLNESSTDAAVAFYSTIFKSVEAVESLECAEMIKLVENTFRFVSIGFANEIARIARRFGLNGWEIIRIAQTKRFGLDLCFPGLIGGHCIPIDPFYLAWATRNRRQAVTFIDVAERSHNEFKREALDLIRRLLNHRDKGVAGSSILLLGVAYKENVSDTRESPAIDLMKRLCSYGAEVTFWDPVLQSHSLGTPFRLYFSDDDCCDLPLTMLEQLKTDVKREESKRYFEPKELVGGWECLRDQVASGEFDCLVIVTHHAVFEDAYADIILSPDGPPIADLRNAVNSWLRNRSSKGGLNQRQLAKLRNKIQDRRNFMLLGLH